jgi:outer membrane protein OmpA-like peptidoglycan-associated protein
MKARRWVAFGLALVLASALTTGASAQLASAPTATGETGLFTLIDGWTVPDGEFSFGLYYNNWDRLVAPVPGGVAAPLTDDWDYDWNRLSVSVGYGITDKLEVSLMAPYDDYNSSDVRHVGFLNGVFFEDEIDASGRGNFRGAMKYQFFGDLDTGEALAMNLFIDLPTGEDEGVSSDDTGFGAGINWNFSRNWVARLGYRDPGDPDTGFDMSEEIEAGLGWAVPVSDRLDWITELAATFYGSGDSDPDDAIDLATGGRYWFGTDRRWAFNFALRTELNQLSDTDEHCPIGGLLGLTMMPQRFRPTVEAAPVAPPPPPPPPPPAPAPAPAPAPPPPPPPPKPAESREEIHFDSDSARLSNIAKAKLDEVALRMKQNPAATALIIGVTDSQGDEAYNQALGLRRAEAAKAYLVSRHQIDGSRISVETRGENDPVATNDTAEGRAENRRAIIIIRL